jgi:two-component system heavy metal sensor histidine kinase CusS
VNRLLRRMDVRLTAVLAVTMGLLLVGLMTVFFLVSTHETAELLAESLAPDLKAVAAEIGAGATGEAAAREAERRGAMAVRRVRAQGGAVLLSGSWPETGRSYGKRTPSLQLGLASPSDHWVQGIGLPGEERVELAAPLAHFVEERREALAQIAVSLAIGLLGAVVASILATRLVLVPLRSATRAVENIDERKLDSRLPVSGTGDDMDRHALALNRVLARLEHAFARVSAFSADVAHELRTPVNRMLNLTDVALMELEGKEPPDALVGARESAEQMRRIIDDLLFLARAEDEKLGTIHIEAVDLVGLLEGLLELYTPACEERGIGLGLRAHESPRMVQTNRRLLERALSNLIDNAVRHAGQGGRVEIGIEPRGGRLEISVCDTGPGIPEVDRERVFERFVQLDPSRAGSHAGLGLPLVRTIARLLGGEARAEASSLGGAALIITLPAGPEGATLSGV